MASRELCRSSRASPEDRGTYIFSIGFPWKLWRVAASRISAWWGVPDTQRAMSSDACGSCPVQLMACFGNLSMRWLSIMGSRTSIWGRGCASPQRAQACRSLGLWLQ
jgi:hypothetical protein